MTQAELNELRKQVNTVEWRKLVDEAFLKTFLDEDQINTMTETEWNDLAADMGLISMGILTYD